MKPRQQAVQEFIEVVRTLNIEEIKEMNKKHPSQRDKGDIEMEKKLNKAALKLATFFDSNGMLLKDYEEVFKKELRLVRKGQETKNALSNDDLAKIKVVFDAAKQHPDLTIKMSDESFRKAVTPPVTVPAKGPFKKPEKKTTVTASQSTTFTKPLPPPPPALQTDEVDKVMKPLDGNTQGASKTRPRK